MKKSYFLGIDVAKNSCNFALLKANRSCLWSGQFDNNSSSIQRWLALLEARKLDWRKILFGFEATGVYSQTLLLCLQQLDLAACQLNPAQVRYFGVSVNRRTKNDPADARLIARFLLERQPVATRSLNPTEHQLKGLVHEREALSIDLARERNRAEKHALSPFQAHPRLVEQRAERLLQLKAWIKDLDAALQELIDSDPALCAKAGLLCSIPGIAFWTAAKILSQLAGKEFQSAHQLALYSGLTPKENQSGLLKGKTTLCKIGNAFLRKALFMPASVAARCREPIKRWASRSNPVAQNSRSSPSAVPSCTNSFIRIIFGVLKNQTPFNPNLACFSNAA